jgi:CRP-like cAMP-binding protein
MGEMIRKTNLSLIEKLKNLSIFKNWSLAQLASLYKHFQKKSYTLHNMLYKAGDNHDYLYVVVKGEVQVG